MPEPLLFTDALAVDTLAQLLALTPTSTPFPRIDGMWLLVREQRQYYLYSQSATTGGVTPNDSTGRWFPFGMTPTPIWTGTSLGWDTTGDGIANISPVDLQGPQGIQGIQGPQGPEGPQGPAGESALGTISVRQAIQNAPVNSDGRADFLVSPSGFTVQGQNISESNPLILAITDTPDSQGRPRDRILRITSNPTWPSPTANSTSFFLVEENEDNSISYLTTTLAPSYGLTLPPSPATGQMHYNTNHTGRAVVWDGSAWVPRRIICVGEAVTGASTVTTLRSYAILGRYRVVVPGQQNRVDILAHNLGIPPSLIAAQCSLIAQSAVIGYSVGDAVPLFMHSRITSPDSSASRGTAEVLERNRIHILQANFNQWFVCDKSTGASVAHTPRSDFSVSYELRRAF